MHRSFFGIAVGLMAAVLVGCGSEPTAEIKGTVTYQGKPLPGATLTFFPSNNKTFTADTKEDGTYTVPVTGRGTVKVSVQVAQPRVPVRPIPTSNPKSKDTFAKDAVNSDDQGKMGRLAPPSETPVTIAIPTIYNNPDTSDLKFELTGGSQTFDIVLK